MSNIRQGFTQGYRLAIFALLMGLVVSLALIAGSGWINHYLDGTHNWYAILLFIGAGASIAATIVSALAASISQSQSGLASKIAGVTVSLLLGVHGADLVTPVPAMMIYALDFFAQVVYATAINIVIMHSLNIKGNWRTYPPYIVGSIILLLGLVGIMGQSWISMEGFLPYVALARSSLIVAAPCVVLLACSLWKPMRLNPQSIVDSFILRLPPRSFQNSLFTTFIAIIVGACINFGLHFSMLIAGPETAGVMPYLMLSWTGILWFSISELLEYFGSESSKSAAANLASSSAKRFLKRNLREDLAWAATVGLKTTSFVVDHDPKGTVEIEIPASLQQIRAEEIQRCVAEVLGATYLHSDVVGHRIHGSIDPETSIRPCVDALKMFSCLYLDAGPLVERRIKGLTALLPIVDPGLFKILNLENLNSLIRRNMWFFHFDYNWTDQHIIHTPRSSRYDVKTRSLQSQVRHSMLDYLEKKGAVGNFVWLSPGARDRLVQEAPVLKNVIETCPVTVGNNQDEVLMFIIKFEHLIPRLQRFFDFDSMRKSILDFEPSQENHRLLTLLRLQANNSDSEKKIKETLDAVTSVPWRGFKEKDFALQIVLLCHQKIAELSKDIKNYKGIIEDLNISLLDAVTKIGYPSQILHTAQLNKLALRDVDTLINAASNRSNVRFHESWLLLSSNEYQRFPEVNKIKILNFLGKLYKNTSVRNDNLAQIKAIDAYSGIAKTLNIGHIALLSNVLSSMSRWLVKADVGPDIICLLLDTQQFVEDHLNSELIITDDAKLQTEQYLESLTTRLGANHPNIIAVMSRWQERINNSMAA